MPSGFLSLLSIITVLVALLIKKYITLRKQHRPYPPGPKPKPIIGNVLDLPTEDVAEVYRGWAKKYNSSVIHASALGAHIVLLSKVEDVNELFVKRATKYSNRPEYPITNLMGWDHNLVLMQYGEQWRYCRQICQENFQKKAAKNYNGVILQKVHAQLDGLLKSPEKFEYHNAMLSISIPMKTMYGYDVESFDDPLIATADKSATLGVTLFIPGGSLINIFPFLAYVPVWFPGASSRKVAAEVKRLTEEVVRFPMDWAKMRMDEGTAVPSLVTNFLEKKNTIGASAKEERAIGDIAFTVYGAASDTVSPNVQVPLDCFFYWMAVNPDVQEKAQGEVDRVVGKNRLPNFSDKTNMPYLEAIYREVLRCSPPLPLGAPHCVTEDDYYKDYFIPKGAVVLANIWAMTHDESVYPEPFAFKPERFFDKNGELNDDDMVLAFGLGRRICAGEHVGRATVWLTFVSVLATFNIEKAKDEFGKDVEINGDYEDFGFLKHKKHFQCSITPRSHGHRQLIEEANMLYK